MNFTFGRLSYFVIKDSNGNMTADLDRDIVAIRYNMLNLPDTVQFRNGSAIVNYYTADGKRTGSKYLTPQTTVVIPAGQPFGSTSGTAAMSSHVTARRGSLEYAGADFESDTLIRIHNGDGYLDCSEQDFRYFVRDYQGNIRTVYGSAVAKLTPVEPPFSLTNRGAIGGDKPPIRPTPIEHTVTYQRMQYYPFGLPYEAHYQPEEQPYKYGGKEFIELHGYDSYDFDARMYYPALCRFMTMDPLCEKYYSISPYAYCNNNPVNYVDPSGHFTVVLHWGWAIGKALLTAFKYIVIAGIAYVSASAISTLKRKQPKIHYYKAKLINEKVYISDAIKTKSKAVIRLKANGNVFATSSGYAYDACKSASPIHKVSAIQKHERGKGQGKQYYHYHPMLKWSKNKNARKQMHVHCWFLK